MIANFLFSLPILNIQTSKSHCLVVLASLQNEKELEKSCQISEAPVRAKYKRLTINIKICMFLPVWHNDAAISNS